VAKSAVDRIVTSQQTQVRISSVPVCVTQKQSGAPLNIRASVPLPPMIPLTAMGSVIISAGGEDVIETVGRRACGHCAEFRPAFSRRSFLATSRRCNVNYAIYWNRSTTSADLRTGQRTRLPQTLRQGPRARMNRSGSANISVALRTTRGGSPGRLPAA